MKRIKIDIPRTSGNVYADKIKKAFIDLGIFRQAQANAQK